MSQESTDAHSGSPGTDALAGNQLCAAGVNHQNAPVDVRERLAVPPEAESGLRICLEQQLDLYEVVALSTCNRTEFYWVADDAVSPMEFLQRLPRIEPAHIDRVRPVLDVHTGREVVQHLFQLVCGLDSQVLGETQILHQVKAAYERSRNEGHAGPFLNPLFQRAFQVAKEAHTQTRLNLPEASIPSAALELAEAIFEDLTPTSVVVIGTGETARLTLDALRRHEVTRFGFVTRTAERAQVWEQTHAVTTWTWDQVDRALVTADIVVACTQCDEPVLRADSVARALAGRPRRNRPILILDLGLPRNVDPAVAGMEQVYLRDLDDLEAVVAEHRLRQASEAAGARRIIDSATEAYWRQWQGRDVIATITEIRSAASRMSQEELERTMARLAHLAPEDQERVRDLFRRVLNKLLHPPTRALHDAMENGRGAETARWARRLLGTGHSSRGRD